MKRKLCSLALVLAACCAAVNWSPAATNETVRVVSADLQLTNGPLNTMFKRCIGAGRANEGLRADWQRQLTIARRECGFEYIRFHGLFTDDMGAPNQLTKAQAAEIKSKSTGAPLETRTVKIGRYGKFTQQFDLRENDAVLITLKPQR